MVFVSAFQTAFSSSLVNFNPLDHQGGWLSKYSATVVVGVAVATVVWRHAWIRCENQQNSFRVHFQLFQTLRKRDHTGRIQELLEVRTPEEVSTSQDSELECFCGLSARLRTSRTFSNPYRLFYSCRKNSSHYRCGYFQWADEVSASEERSRKEIIYLRQECIRLHKKVAYVQSRREYDIALWQHERSVLKSKFFSARAELKDIKRRIQPLYGMDNMPPVDESYISDGDDDGAMVIEAT